ncbi:MAG: 5'-methylthioadenosine/S-adenosylhomocysteine nucleosidase [Alphaproteobacteria bacterium]|uniref:5'-methylthioadenosine/S-adenosylhomocysteine nucleosidase n=1 Tax=Brevundimonas sp. TaxID=1871086 RepID=UPI001DFBF221|nr:5'-methylthioadenosine/S-adenosylhomocysteine nucleosidase [Alphaproteobacteria bacterium]MBU1521485.1 5'-methylthioadenosine/S-adenosylhomocysteine nucleosidase [Alphaproteobacteria bacterium]MBU2031916.1 5'-methylthioadenosine/S-adenosylhomocysteine nucleosidase [Alphaproteobacteria bacterium]MBU2165920.1 5'-methylthioadenosine/S-adenosylhomocysteine nucleosidase [Alphaproteobacteria bacterium]MBU2231163.1 5'-methylthioadenosine/S-adenosylhomocysteine nucleosidase [Alphaproteobacteria bact
MGGGLVRHGEVSVLYVMAAPAEYGDHLRARIQPLMTGVGPVEAAVVLTAALTRLEAGGGLPDLIVSLGSCGSRVLEHACVYQASSVAYRDMDASPLGFPKGVTPLLEHPAILPLPCPIPGVPTATLSTGANVVSGAAYDAIEAEMVDMETWALVRSAQTSGVPLVALRGVSDGRAELKALEDWTSTLHHVDENLAAALDRLTAVLEAEGLAALNIPKLEIPALHGQDPAQPPAPDSITP